MTDQQHQQRPGIIFHTADPQFHSQPTYYPSCATAATSAPLSMPPMTYEGPGTHPPPHLLAQANQLPYQAYHTYCPTFHPTATTEDLPMLDAAARSKQDYTTMMPAMHVMTPVTTFLSPANGLAPQHATATAIPISTGHMTRGMVDAKSEMQRPTNLPMANGLCPSSSPMPGAAVHYQTQNAHITSTPLSSQHMHSPFASPGAKSRADFHKTHNEMGTPGAGHPSTCDSRKLAGEHAKAAGEHGKAAAGISRASARSGSTSMNTVTGERPPAANQRTPTRSTSRSSPTHRSGSGSGSGSGNKSSQSKRASSCSTQPSRCLPKNAKTILREWLESNLEYPYPSDQEKQKLAKMASITALQVSYWFVNARRRLLPRLLDEANHQRTSRNLPPIQIHPCARFSESFRPSHIKCDLTGPVSAQRKPSDAHALKSHAPMQQGNRDITLYSHALQTYDIPPPLILSHPHVITQQLPHSVSGDGSDTSSDDTSYTWPRQARGNVGAPTSYYANGLHQQATQQPINVTMTQTAISPSMPGKFPCTPSSMPSSREQFDAAASVSASPREVMHAGGVKMPPPPFTFPNCQEKQGQQLDSNQISIHSPSFLPHQQQQQQQAQQGQQQFCNQQHSLQQGQQAQKQSGKEESSVAISGLSPPITPSVTSPGQTPAPQPQFLFPTTMVQTSPVPTFYASRDPNIPAMIHPGHAMGSYVGY